MNRSDFLAKLLRLPMVSHPLVSPDGKLVAWSWLNKDERVNVYVALTDGSGKPKKLTDAADDMQVVSWTADSRFVIVETCEDGNERMQLLRIAVTEPFAVEPLTKANPPYFIHGGDQHANGRYLVAAVNFDFRRRKTVEASYVYRFDLKTGARKLLASPKRSPEKGRNAPTLNAQGTHVLYFRSQRHPGGQQVHLVRLNGKGDREILNFGDSVKVNACWMPDGKRILFVCEAGHYRRLGMYHRKHQTIEWLINDPQRNIEHAWPLVGAKNTVVVLEVMNAREHCLLLDVRSKGEAHVVPRRSGGTLIPLSLAVDGKLVAVYYDCVRPADLVRCAMPKDGCVADWCAMPAGTARLATRSLTGAGKQRPAAKHLCQAEDFHWSSVDGLSLHGFFYRAKNPCGTIVLAHGGPRDRSEARFDAKVQYLVWQGFNVFQPNYRGSTGYGLHFQEAIKVEGWGGIEQQDIRSGIEALVKAGLAKYGQIGITGTSYGGYSSWHAITHFSTKIVAAAAPICGMTDLVVDYNTTRPDLRTLSEEMMGGTPQAVPEKYFERSPVNFVANIKAKVLIAQGNQDPNVTPENVNQVRRALKAAGVRYQLLPFENEGHGIAKPENQAVLFTSLSRFFSEAFCPQTRR